MLSIISTCRDILCVDINVDKRCVDHSTNFDSLFPRNIISSDKHSCINISTANVDKDESQTLSFSPSNLAGRLENIADLKTIFYCH